MQESYFDELSVDDVHILNKIKEILLYLFPYIT